jgi:hypothetical protein
LRNGYRSVNVPFYLPFLNCCGPLWGRDVYCSDQTLNGERVSWAFHISRRIQESSGEGLGTRIRPTGALLFARAGGEKGTAVLPGPSVWAGSLLFMRAILYGPTGYCSHCSC